MSSKTNRLVDKHSYMITRGHDFVEINGVKWATCNLGAEKPEDPGWYFMWGDNKPYQINWVSPRPRRFHPHWDGREWIKYSLQDNKLVLDPEDDAAHVLWGGKWRVPTMDEFDSLINSSPKDIEKLGLVNGRAFWVSNKVLSGYPPEYIRLFLYDFHIELAKHMGFRDNLNCIRPVLDV